MQQRCNRDFAFLCPLARTKIHSCRRKCRFCTRNRFPLSQGNVLTTRCDSLRHDNPSRSHSVFAFTPRTNQFSLASIDEISEASPIDAKFVLSTRWDRTIIIVWDAESLGFIMMRYHPIPAPSYNRIIRNINLPNRKAWSVQNYNRVAVLKPKLKVTEMITGSIVVSFYYIHRVSAMRKVKYLFKIFNDPPSDFFHASVIVQEARAWTGLPREYKRRAVAKREESKHVTVQQDRGSALYGPVN